MDVLAELEREPAVVARITSVASCKESLGFLDLCRGEDLGEFVDRIVRGENPGMQFTSRTRMVVFEFHSGALRYYAGGWCPENKQVEEWDRFTTEGSELGDFPSVQAALAFAEAYLVGGQCIQAIYTSRHVLWRQDTGDRAEPGRCP